VIIKDYRCLITGGKLASDNTNLSIIPASETNLCLISMGPFSRCVVYGLVHATVGCYVQSVARSIVSMLRSARKDAISTLPDANAR
jgi:hypothetical protein